jgi:hypothetical protein
MKPAYCVHLIVDRAFTVRLNDLPRPVWIADTSANRPAIEEAWNQEGTETHLDGVTSYQPRTDNNISQEILDLISTIEEHHGVFSHDPQMDALKIMVFQMCVSFPLPLRNSDFAFRAARKTLVNSINNTERAPRPILHKLALGLLKHPDRQLSRADHR